MAGLIDLTSTNWSYYTVSTSIQLDIQPRLVR